MFDAFPVLIPCSAREIPASVEDPPLPSGVCLYPLNFRCFTLRRPCIYQFVQKDVPFRIYIAAKLRRTQVPNLRGLYLLFLPETRRSS